MSIFSITKRFILVGLFCSINTCIFSQNIGAIQINGIWQLNDSSLLYQADTISELWIKDKSLDIWKLGESSELITFCNAELRIWRQASKLSFWIFDKEKNDWILSESINPGKQKLNDSISFTLINDSIKWVDLKGKNYIFKTSDKIFLWNKNNTSGSYLINDTIGLYPVDDTTNLWTYKDSSVIWNLNPSPKIWEISNSTIVWTIDNRTEFWKAGNQYNIWNRPSINKQWKKDTTIYEKKLDSVFNYWNVNPNIIIFSKIDSVQIWQSKPREPIWKLGDSIRIWRLKPPKIIEIEIDTVVIPEKTVKKSDLLEAGKHIKLWTINDSTKLYHSDDHVELWRINNKVKSWKISDSTIIWNIDKGTKLSMISDTLTVWKKKDDDFEWKHDSLRQAKRIAPNLVILDINDSARFSRIYDTVSIWNCFGSIRLASQSSVNKLLVNQDTVEIWEANDSTKLWIDKYGESGKVWEKNKNVNILNINDSTKIWQINENVRLSIINNKLKIWRQGIDDPNISWKESSEFKYDNIMDSVKAWHINPGTIIWETRQKIEVWDHNKKHETIRLNDTCLIYTYSTSQVPPKLPKPKFWTLLGTGKMDIAQVWLEKWSKGGEKSISTLFIVNLQANYAKRKVKWNNDFEYRYGFIRPGEKPLRKNEDKIKINSIFNYYAFNKFYYGFTLTGLSQFFKGYNYINDTTRIVVSDYMAPLYLTVALGINYFPVKQLSVFFSPLTYKSTFVRDTSIVDQTNYGVEQDERVKRESGIIVKSILNWDLSKNINVLSKLDLFTRYKDIKKYNVDWETTFTFKFTNLITATLNTHLIYDPAYFVEENDGSKSNPVQFKEVFSIGLFYKI